MSLTRGMPESYHSSLIACLVETPVKWLTVAIHLEALKTRHNTRQTFNKSSPVVNYNNDRRSNQTGTKRRRITSHGVPVVFAAKLDSQSGTGTANAHERELNQTNQSKKSKKLAIERITRKM
jgi:hypothetical protein